MKSLQLPAICVLSLVCLSAGAETMYIRDTLYVPLRTGESLDHRVIHRGLKSGTRVERLEVGSESGFSLVRTGEGLEGWLQSQYLTSEMVAADRLADLQLQLQDLADTHQQTLRRLERARAENEATAARQAHLEAENLRLEELEAIYRQTLRSLEEARAENERIVARQASQAAEMAASQASLAAENDDLNAELQYISSISADVITLDRENRQLTRDRDHLLDQIGQLNLKNETIAGDRSQDWFLIGACTVGVGLLCGFWCGRLLYHRRLKDRWV